METEKKYEKMSKSKGNCILPEEVMYGVYEIDENYIFIDEYFNIVKDFQRLGAWRNKQGDGQYYTNTIHGRRPIFLSHNDLIPCPPLLEGCVQHPGCFHFWKKLEEAYDENSGTWNFKLNEN